MGNDKILDQATALLDSGRAADAAALLRKQWEHYPDDAEIANAFACVCFHLERYDEAKSIFTVLQEYLPPAATTLNNLGFLHLRIGQPRQATMLFREALTLAPDDPELKINLASALNQDQQSEAALAIIDELLAADPHCAIALNNRGVILRKLERTSEARECFEQVLAIDTCDANALNNLGCLAMTDGDLKSANDYFSRALANDPHNQTHAANLASAQAKLHASETHA